MHNVGRGALDLWLRMLLRDITALQVGDQGMREDLQHDIRSEIFYTVEGRSFDASEMTPGVLCMYVI